MKAHRRVSKYARCPYYSEESYQQIFCEGIIPHSSLTLSFGNVDDKKDHVRDYCCANYQLCCVCQMHNRRYEERDG
jgi:hypothetical protein